ncbi:hypothetical protein D499_0D01870 [Hanseniaspora uvarum DSM 2768]|nr:hypothetical protein D499_0D01870 [Hanseniaspora uvarum DSM 2768]
MKNNLNFDLYKHYNKETKMFQCFICKKSFSRPSSLAIHKNIHSGERPFECEQCKKRFNVLSNLRRHKKIHESNDNKKYRSKNPVEVVKKKIYDDKTNTERPYHKLKPLSLNKVPMNNFNPSLDPYTQPNNSYFIEMQKNMINNQNMFPNMMFQGQNFIGAPNHIMNNMNYYFPYNQQLPYQNMPVQQMNYNDYQQNNASTSVPISALNNEEEPKDEEKVKEDNEEKIKQHIEEEQTESNKKSVLSISELLNSSSNDNSISSE